MFLSLTQRLPHRPGSFKVRVSQCTSVLSDYHTQLLGNLIQDCNLSGRTWTTAQDAERPSSISIQYKILSAGFHAVESRGEGLNRRQP